MTPVLASSLLWIATALSADPPRDAAPSIATVVEAIRSHSSGPRWATTNAEAHGRLTLLKVDVDFRNVSARAARGALANAIGLNLVEHGTNEAAPTEDSIDLSLRGVLAIDALRAILESDANRVGSTWQIRDGILEVGPRAILARRTTPETRVVDVEDLLIRAPNFRHPGDPSTSDRRSSRELGAELVGMVVAQVEPDAWHPLTEAERADGLVDPVDPRDPWQGRNLDPRRRDPVTGTLAPIFVQGRWASIRLHDGSIVVRAPAFVLRGIEGLPTAVPPPSMLLAPHRSSTATPQ